MTARTSEEILRDLQSSIEQSDPSWDTAQGPIRDVFIAPVSGIVSKTEQDAEDLRRLFSLDFQDVITEDEIRKALSNFGSVPGEGTRSTHTQYFMRSTRPREDVTVSAGSLVSNSTGNLVYRTISTVIMEASQADSYFNPSRRVYEVAVKVEAVGVGPEYALPAKRVQTILTPINGIDGTENRQKSSQGLPTESTVEQAARLKSVFLGLNLNSRGGLPKKITDTLPNQVQLVQMIVPGDAEFTRIQIKPSVDMYVLGSMVDTVTDTIAAVAGQTEFILENQPVITVASAKVNGVPVEYSLVKDDSSETKESIRSVDTVVLNISSLASDVVEIVYTYNKALNSVNELVLNSGSESLFRTDCLVRDFKRVKPQIGIELKVLSSYTFDEVATLIRSWIQDYLETPILREKVTPTDIRDSIKSEINGIQTLRITKFRRDTGSLSNIEVIVLAKNEVTNYEESFVEIRAVK